MEHSEWIWAAVAFGSGLLFGEIAGRLVRGAMARVAATVRAQQLPPWARSCSGRRLPSGS
ncbi:MAG: hypothetical protein V9E94_19775 [Microthrixaceae bacterium]